MDFTEGIPEDKKEHGLNKDFLFGLVHKDMENGLNFYYIKVDKRVLDNPPVRGDMDKLIELYLKAEFSVINAYAEICFDEDTFKNLSCTKPVIKYIKEQNDEEEDTVWLVFKVSFYYIYNDRSGIVSNMAGITTIKHDYIAPVPVNDKTDNMWKDAGIDLEKMNAGDITSISEETFNSITETRKEINDGISKD